MTNEKIRLIGRVGDDPSRNGEAVKFSLLISYAKKDRSGVDVKQTIKEDCSAYGKVGQYIMANIKKGAGIMTCGRIVKTENNNASQIIVHQINIINTVSIQKNDILTSKDNREESEQALAQKHIQEQTPDFGLLQERQGSEIHRQAH